MSRSTPLQPRPAFRGAFRHAALLALCVGLLAMATSDALFAQAAGSGTTAKDATPPIFSEEIDVRVIQVEAVVTRRGDPVPSLGPDDFVLRVDGEEVPIEYFTEVRQGLAVDDSGPGSKSASASSAVPALELGRPAPTWYLVFVDDDFTIESRRDRVLRGLADDLHEMGPEDRMAIVAWDGRRLELLANWSRSDATLERALRRAQDRPAYGLHRRSEWQRLVDDLSFRGRSGGGSSFTGIGFAGARSQDSRRPSSAAESEDGAVDREVVASEVGRKVARVATAAASALRGLGGVEGRKVMLLVSGGLPALGDAGLPLDDRLGRLGRFDQLETVRHLYRPVIEAANRLGFTLYPVDAGDRIGPSLGGAESATVFEADLRRANARESRLLNEDVAFHLADATGGEPIVSSAASSALERVRQDTRSYYWLGFTPSWRGDDSAHEVEVEVRRRGHDVRFRRGFVDLSATARASLAVESAHLFDVPVPGAEPLEAVLGEPRSEGLRRLRVPLVLRLPVSEVLAPEGVARLELRIAATDDRGDVADVPVIEVQLDPSAPLAASWSTTLELRRRPHRLLVALRDPLAGRVWSKSLELEP